MSEARARACLELESPEGHRAAREYVYRLLLEELLGFEVRVVYSVRSDVRMRCIDAGGDRCLDVADGLFALPEADWLEPKTLPHAPLPVADVASLPALEVTLAPLPVLFPTSFPDGHTACEPSERGMSLRVDVFGSAFFMLTRYEEAIAGERDEHARFPAAVSLAVRADFIERPIVNEYVELLWACMKTIWPSLTRRQREFALKPSHDVDLPLEYGFLTASELLRKLAGGLISGNKSLAQTARAAIDGLRVRAGELKRDPAFTFDWIMDASERHGLKSAFYFLVDPSERDMGSLYRITHPSMSQLLRRIHRRGHEIGLHASYRSLGDAQQLRLELELLQAACRVEGIEQERWGVRHHYLRWDTPRSFRALDAAGFAYDTTLGFADRAGFRCGACFEYPVFDVVARRALRLRERPLVMMEWSVMGGKYMGLGPTEAAFGAMLRVQDACRKVRGDFTFLWHNSRLSAHERQLYQRLLDAGISRGARS